tara:strand:+ start:943 stop:1209 length:267 start_codon:yes stop_codon:yes gene_type:complete
MDMKPYKNKNQLLKDVLFVKSILLDEKYKSFIVSVLFDQWLSTAEDSPWYANEEEDFTETPVKINENGQSSEWKGEHILFEDILPLYS